MKRRTLAGAAIVAAAVIVGRRPARRPGPKPGGGAAAGSEPTAGRAAPDEPAAASRSEARPAPPVEKPVWRRVAESARRRIRQENLALTAAGLAFYAFLALVPALIAVVTVYGLISDPADVERQVAELAEALPENARGVVEEQLNSIASSPSAGLGIGLVLSLFAMLWTASGGMAALVKGINTAFGEEETRGFLLVRGISLALTVGAIALVVCVGFVAAALPLVLRSIGFEGAGRVLVEVGRWPLLLATLVMGIALLYRIGPDRVPPRWRVVTWGALVAAALWLAATAGFSLYVGTLGSYNQTYGFLGGVVVLLLWFFISGFSVLLGAVVDSELEGVTGAGR